MEALEQLAREAEDLLRAAATDRLPVDAGRVGLLMHVIRRVYDLGREETHQEFASGQYEAALATIDHAMRCARRMAEHERGPALAGVAQAQATLALTGFKP